jgi:hypothetical protein
MRFVPALFYLVVFVITVTVTQPAVPAKPVRPAARAVIVDADPLRTANATGAVVLRICTDPADPTGGCHLYRVERVADASLN